MHFLTQSWQNFCDFQAQRRYYGVFALGAVYMHIRIVLEGLSGNLENHSLGPWEARINQKRFQTTRNKQYIYLRRQ